MLRVVIAGAGGESGRAVSGALRKAGHEVIGIGHDTERDIDLANAAAVNALAAELGPVDGLVHLAGGWRGGRDDADWQWLLERNVESFRNTTRAFFDALAASPSGRIAMVSSTAVDVPTWGGANYAVAKAATEAWSRSAAAGFAKGGTAASVVFVVKSLGADGTPFDVLGERVTALWDSPASELNGARIRLY
ncbi:MAG: alcohol dehydrogenase [Rhodoglobus sp.]|nr:alcohol dehydrogenase [Rhodoglobus sp.]